MHPYFLEKFESEICLMKVEAIFNIGELDVDVFANVIKKGHLKFCWSVRLSESRHWMSLAMKYIGTWEKNVEKLT